eukprot:CAMPEP_0197294336 /NCGR_PEP_ID=MMETSP0890-20130614/32135_1 /TAXON_ID=44058 ORGANISM="Aureoumbra lagunensis, Strain CCMP1510" /NCGR_SAMPLE_ID=MMETSP0890 /ASSEMBLY_ACC=CAM_ASM_000533 /LENGTH=73 /DNA_ID=CAMNT_0042769701 /DNA_START=37 /DNA_END=258 /DNA_ORIENTATION=-
MAFVAPQSSMTRGLSTTARPAVESVDVTAAATELNNMLVAVSESDFGGYFFPAAGLTLLGAIIVYLSPPLKDE